jgi:hypothetical protein
MKNCHSSSDVPINKQHFAVVRFSSIHIEGDERSRQCPGHGYPTRNEPKAEYITFDDAEDLNKWVSNHIDDDFIVLNTNRMKINVETIVRFN